MPRLILISLLLISATVLSTGGALGGEEKVVANLVLTNPSDFERSGEAVRLELPSLGLSADLAGALSVLDGNVKLSSQVIDFNADGQPDSFVLQADFDAGQVRRLQIVKSSNPAADQGGIAMAGTAFMPMCAGLGGLTRGDVSCTGHRGIWDGERLRPLAGEGAVEVRVVDNGPVFIQSETRYRDLQSGSDNLDISALQSLETGGPLVQTRMEFTEDPGAFAIGIGKKPGLVLLTGELEVSGHGWTWSAGWETEPVGGKHRGVMLLFKKQDLVRQVEGPDYHVTVLRLRNLQTQYYFGAVQGPAGKATEAGFRKLVEKEAEKLTLPLRRQLTTSRTEADFASTSPLEWSRRLAHSEMVRNGDDLAFGGYDRVSNRKAAWRYTTGLLALALDDVARAVGDRELGGWARATIDSYITDEGEIRTYKLSDFNIDKINSGKMLLRLYERTGEEKYRVAAGRLREQLKDHPRTSEGGFWHKKIYPWQLWLDGVYMGMPFLAQYASMNGDDEALEEAVNEFLLVRRHLRDPETGLYYHGWDEKRQQNWADPETGLSAEFWSRGLGWYAMALVDVLDFVPEDRADLREPLLEIIGDLAETLLKYRQKSGWYQVMDRPDGPGNYPEASGSSMFVYMLAKAVNRGYLGPEYKAVAVDAWDDLVRQFVNVSADGSVSLDNICSVAGLGFGRDGTYRYYMSEPVISNDPKGTAPFIMAGIQVDELMGIR